MRSTSITTGLLLLLTIGFGYPAYAEDDEQSYFGEEATAPTEEREVPPPPPMNKGKSKATKAGPRNYYNNNEPRSDSGVFHVAIAVGGNFYTEPQVDSTTQAPTGESFKDFGFQAGVFFDWDYSELDQNIPLGLRGMVGYKYILNSVHVFSFDGVVRQMWRFSENSSFGLGLGGSAAIWYRAITDNSPNEEIIFLPSFIVSAGFDFNPFMADFKVLVNRWGEDALIGGVELYFGFRL